MKNRIMRLANSQQFICRNEILCGISMIPRFYERRDFNPAWPGKNGDYSQADYLMEMLQESYQDGFNPTHYHFTKIKSLLALIRNNPSGVASLSSSIAIDLDLLLTDAFFLFASHLASGRVNPETIHTKWEAFVPEIDLSEVLQNALDSNSIKETLKALAPSHPNYIKLRKWLTAYRNIAETSPWPTVPFGTSLKIGSRNRRVKILRERLVFSGDLKHNDPGLTYIFDSGLEAGVKQFQRRHGLIADGVVGPKTLDALNVPVETRIRQIEINMERWHWIPRDLGVRYILVNIADFKLSAVENHQSVLDMRVVVGRSYRKTPVFTEKLKFIVLNPFWNIPTSIAVEDVIPRICNNIKYIGQNNIIVFKNWADYALELDPGTIEWCDPDLREYFPYKLQQAPGFLNPLGRIKFIFPNKYAVYLHDTPQRGLFSKMSRDFSSGCIRVEKPFELAAYILKKDPDWTKDNLRAEVKTGKRKVIPVMGPLPVHLLYWTALVDEKGNIRFIEDIYNQDEPLGLALKETPPRVLPEMNE